MWERHLSFKSGSNLLAFFSCLHSGKHKAPGPSAGCEGIYCLSPGDSAAGSVWFQKPSSCPTLVWGSWGSVETDDV